MKLDIAPEKNRRQLEYVRSFSVGNMLMLKKGFYQFLGSTCIIAGITLLFTNPDGSILQPDRYSRYEIGAFSILTGTAILFVTIMVSKWWKIMAKYEPKESSDDEWQQ
ncbi:hypothetical protein [Parahaliea mediterranea]|uniref:Uncharacterized protein n=1 Tax=Parahaliea mediterranea TaxID=651086 RepID=A0A939DIW6_9GAMM|nr:hypothetical protein [Parahaliea mediterranea]MBN7799175.1 hypothetical protein [Parahaliea mediterranea]